ncbi:MAG: small multi-drug export protein [Clostridia bacterium]|nr:small multi-drug export protein [Clostridia bacterium]
MKEAIVNFLQSITGSPWATVAVFSMFPLIELKGAIPVGEALGLILWQTALLAYVGSTLVCVPVYFLLRPVFNLLKRWKAISRLVEKIEGVFSRRAARIAEKSGKSEGKALTGMLSLGVFAFVAVPLPLTGVWTGTAIAVFLGLKFKDTILPVMLGNLAAGSVITLLTFLFRDYVEYIILGLFAIAIIMLIVFIVRIARSKPEENAGPPESGREDQ